MAPRQWWFWNVMAEVLNHRIQSVWNQWSFCVADGFREGLVCVHFVLILYQLKFCRHWRCAGAARSWWVNPISVTVWRKIWDAWKENTTKTVWFKLVFARCDVFSFLFFFVIERRTFVFRQWQSFSSHSGNSCGTPPKGFAGDVLRLSCPCSAGIRNLRNNVKVLELYSK